MAGFEELSEDWEGLDELGWRLMVELDLGLLRGVFGLWVRVWIVGLGLGLGLGLIGTGVEVESCFRG